MVRRAYIGLTWFKVVRLRRFKRGGPRRNARREISQSCDTLAIFYSTSPPSGFIKLKWATQSIVPHGYAVFAYIDLPKMILCRVVRTRCYSFAF
jgi:hypothetical protein